MIKKLIQIFIAIFLIFAFFALYEFYLTKEAKDEGYLVLYGNVDVRTVDLGFRVFGKLKTVKVEEGDLVKEGDLVAELDETPYFDELKKAQAQIESTKISLENADQIYKRRSELVPRSAVSREDYEDARAKRNELKARLKEVNATFEQAKRNLEDTKSYAPIEGFILTRILEPGSIVRIGDPVVSLSVKSPVWVRAYVSETNLGWVFPGMKAFVYTDSSDKVYEGHVGFISPNAEFTPKNVETTVLRTDLVFRLRVIIDYPDEGLRQGMPVTVKLHTKEAPR
jgi:HlyD family secretion protein